MELFNHLYNTTTDNDELVLLSRELGVIGLHVTAANIGLSHRNLLLVLLLLLVALGALEVWREEQIRKKMIWRHFHILESMWALTECCMSFYEQSGPFEAQNSPNVYMHMLEHLSLWLDATADILRSPMEKRKRGCWSSNLVEMGYRIESILYQTLTSSEIKPDT